MRRRAALLLASAGPLGVWRRAGAQVRSGPARIGWLLVGPHPNMAAFRDGMVGLGYVEGADYLLVERHSGGREDVQPALVDELLREGIDLLLASGTSAVRAVARATRDVPVVAVAGDLVGAGVAESQARPGRNVTGISVLSTDLAAKWLQLATEVLPRARRLALLGHPATRGATDQAQAAAPALGVEAVRLEAATPGEIDAAFGRAAGERADAVVVLSSPFFNAQKRRIVDLAARHRLPAVYEHRDFAEAGGLLSYGPDLDDVYQHVAGYVDRVLKGARPGELPIEQPTRLELVVNLGTARAIGIEIPPSILLRADEVIE